MGPPLPVRWIFTPQPRPALRTAGRRHARSKAGFSQGNLLRCVLRGMGHLPNWRRQEVSCSVPFVWDDADEIAHQLLAGGNNHNENPLIFRWRRRRRDNCATVRATTAD